MTENPYDGDLSPPGSARPVRVMIIDDSALVRDILSAGLARAPGIEVVGTASDPFDAGEKIPRLRPDVLTLDVEMPRMNGIEFLRRLMPQYPLPVIMVSALTSEGGRMTLDALAIGAVDFVTKPRGDSPDSIQTLLADLTAKIKAAAGANLTPARASADSTRRLAPAPVSASAGGRAGAPSRKVVAIGASTGGSEAVRQVLRHLPADNPGVLVVQHMPSDFTRLFAERLDSQCRLTVREAVDGDAVCDGLVLVAPGGTQMRLRRGGGDGWRVEVRADDTAFGHQPSVDVLLESVAAVAGGRSVGVVLTGMGDDGAKALKKMRDAGARCFAQDQATSVVFGMPAEAYRLGGAERLVPLPEIADVIIEALRGIR